MDSERGPVNLAQTDAAAQSVASDRMRAWLSGLLTIGTAIAAAMVLVGLAISLARSGGSKVDLSTFTGEPSQLDSVGRVWKHATAFTGRAIMQFGVLILIATPVARVIFSGLLFAKERDRFYVMVCLIVLAGLALGLLGIVE